MNKQQTIKQLCELKDAHGDVSLPVSRVISILEGVKENAPQNDLTIIEDELTQTIMNAMSLTFDGDDLIDFNLSLEGGFKVVIVDVEISFDMIEDMVRTGVCNYLKNISPNS